MNTPAQRGDVLWQKTFLENVSLRKDREADRRVPPVRFEFLKEAAELDGAREPRWSPAAIHGEAGESGSTSMFGASFLIGGWW